MLLPIPKFRSTNNDISIYLIFLSGWIIKSISSCGMVAKNHWLAYILRLSNRLPHKRTPHSRHLRSSLVNMTWKISLVAYQQDNFLTASLAQFIFGSPVTKSLSTSGFRLLKFKCPNIKFQSHLSRSIIVVVRYSIFCYFDVSVKGPILWNGYK